MSGICTHRVCVDITTTRTWETNEEMRLCRSGAENEIPKAVEINLYSRNSGAGPNHNVLDEDCPQKRNLALQVPTSMGGLEKDQRGSKDIFAAPGEGKGGLVAGDRK